MIHGQDRDSLYFGYQPVAEHFGGCALRGSNCWEVTVHHDKTFGGDVRTTQLRYACHQCGAVTFERFDGEHAAVQHDAASKIGYASKPERVAGLYLWAGPHLFDGDKRGPATYLITVTGQRPAVPQDCLGLVGWGLGKRGGVVWQAGFGVTGRGYVGRPAGHDFRTRNAAVRWIKDQTTPEGAAA